MTELCPFCGQEVRAPIQPSRLTDRELDVLSAWWHTGTVKRAALLAGVGEQRAKNLLLRARSRNGAGSTDALAQMFLDQLKPKAMLLAQHNNRVRGVA